MVTGSQRISPQVVIEAMCSLFMVWLKPACVTWILHCLFSGKGSDVHLLNSTRSTACGSFVELQLALIAITQEPTFNIVYWQVKRQAFNTNACGELAIAYATELAFQSDSKVQYVNFDLQKLRSHLFDCIKVGKLSRFPCLDKRRFSKKLGVEQVKVHCCCRLPDHYDKVQVLCSKCRVWFHLKCQGLVTKPATRCWYCTNCTNGGANP